MSNDVTPEDPDFGNKHIEDKGHDLLSSQLFPLVKGEPISSPVDFIPATFDEVVDTVEDEPEDDPTEEFEPSDLDEQRRVVALHVANSLGHNEVVNLLAAAKSVENYLKTGETQMPEQTPPNPAAHGGTTAGEGDPAAWLDQG